VTTAILCPYLKQRWVDGQGNPLYLGQIATYQAGTLTPIATYTNQAGTLNTNPIVLNARGECDLWLLPNVAYKFVVTDVNGNQIPGGVIDNVTSSQLLNLYGGVDTGSVNSYLLNFTANFTAYGDGIVIIWIPANTNTGASTINVNGLGVVNIVNFDGSALLPGEIVQNQPAQILFKGGQFELLTSNATSYGTFTALWNGFSAAPAVTTVNYRKNGSLVTLIFPQTTGTSNSATWTMTGLPALLSNSAFTSQLVPCVGLVDNSVSIPGGSILILPTAHQISFFKDGTATANWTTSGQKGFSTPSVVHYTL
jgi:hypothetical protein